MNVPFQESYVADTHAVLWHLTNNPKLSTEARRRFLKADEGEAVIFVSAISSIEILYMLEKDRIPEIVYRQFHDTIRSQADSSYQAIDLTYTIAQELSRVPRNHVPEMADRIITATAIHLGVPLITKDHRLQQWEGIVTVW